LAERDGAEPVDRAVDLDHVTGLGRRHRRRPGRAATLTQKGGQISNGQVRADGLTRTSGRRGRRFKPGRPDSVESQLRAALPINRANECPAGKYDCLVPESQPRAAARLRWTAVGLHALVVAAMLALFYAAEPIPEGDADLGKGLVGLALLGLGLPWTLLIFLIDPQTHNGLSPIARGIVDFGPAVLNVVLHAVLPTAFRRSAHVRREAHRP
jgi:hypothetical protein